MRYLKILVLVVCLGAGAWWLWSTDSQAIHAFKTYFDGGEVLTLEARFTPEQIVNAQRQSIIVDEHHILQEPTLKFYPYLMMDVKFLAPNEATREGVLLWSLTDGEIVINADTWETTHGFGEAIDAGASRNDFKILQALAFSQGGASRDDLIKKLHVEPQVLENWIASARDKHLIVQKGGEYYLHFQNPKFDVLPQTKITRPLVSKPYSYAVKLSGKYSAGNIEKNAKAAFGSDFTIRSSKEVYLPVYSIEVLNPDGSLFSTQWNALNGQRIHTLF